jgi:MraZ protein
MAISKNQVGWMALGGMFCLFGYTLFALSGDNQATAQDKGELVVPAPIAPPVNPANDPFVDPITLKAPVTDKGVSPPLPVSNLGAPEKTVPPVVPQDIATGVPDSRVVLPPDIRVITPNPTKTSLPVPEPIGPSTTPASPLAPIPAPTVSAPPVGVPAPDVNSPVPGTVKAPMPSSPVARTEYRTEGEPPLAPHPGPVQVYHVRHEGETIREIARKTLGNVDRWEDVVKLNPSMKPDAQLTEGVVVRLPAEACIPTEEVETVKPLPVLRKPNAARAKALPLMGTYPCNLDEKHTIALPKSIREQLGNCETVMVSPGPDQCLWVTNQAHLDRLAERLENSPAREVEVRVFKRLFYAQTERVTVSGEGRVQISERLAQFAGLSGEVVLVGIDDHFELWDVARWKQYTQQQSGATSTVSTEE